MPYDFLMKKKKPKVHFSSPDIDAICKQVQEALEDWDAHSINDPLELSLRKKGSEEAVAIIRLEHHFNACMLSRYQIQWEQNLKKNSHFKKLLPMLRELILDLKDKLKLNEITLKIRKLDIWAQAAHQEALVFSKKNDSKLKKEAPSAANPLGDRRCGLRIHHI